MIKYLELALSQEVYEYLEELDEMNWSTRGNVLNRYLRNTSIGTTVRPTINACKMSHFKFCRELQNMNSGVGHFHLPD
jgi:hypothetical protein